MKAVVSSRCICWSLCVNVQRSVEVSRTLQDLYEDRDAYVL